MIDYANHPARRGDGSYIVTALAGGIEPERRFEHAPRRMPNEAEMEESIDGFHWSANPQKQGLLGERTTQSVATVRGRSGE